MSTILDLQATDDPRDIVHRSVQALVEGHVIGVPTETVYALAAHALCEESVERLFALKGDAGDAFAMVVSVRSREAADDFFCQPSPLVRRLSRRCWPGPLTLVVPCECENSAVHQLPEAVRRRMMNDQGEVAFRVVDHRVMAHIHRYLSAPLVITGATRPDQPAATTAEAVPADLKSELPLLLDDGPTRYGGESTVVRVRGNHWELLREGAIELAAMKQFVKPVIALVCTGNTCRSPMAETLLREHLRQKLGREDAVRVLSAGMAAAAGSGAAPQAVEVMGRLGMDLTGHCSRSLDSSVMNVADLVLTMTRGHRDAILAAWPDMYDRVFTLRRDEGDVTDPVGMPLEVYQACAEQMDVELAKWVEALDDSFFPSSTSNSD